MSDGSRSWDPEAMGQIAGYLDHLAQQFDDKAASAPQVDGGPFGKPVQAIMESVAADSAGLVMRLVAAADELRTTAARTAGIEVANQTEVHRVMSQDHGDRPHEQ